MRTKRFLVTLPAAFVLAFAPMAPRHAVTAQGAAANKKPSSSLNVTTTVYDFDANGTQLLMRSDDYNGTGLASYTTIKSKPISNYVYSMITADGQWQLSMGEDQSVRTVWITPDQAVDGTQPAAPPAGYYVIQKTYSICRDQSGNTVPFSNLINGSGNCSLAVNFFYEGILYKLLMRPGSLDGTLCPSGGCPATGMARVTCNSVSGDQCVNWTITPNADVPLVGVSNLYSYTGPRGSEWVYIGQYYNTFRINASNP
jgi:hypothetical protein